MQQEQHITLGPDVLEDWHLLCNLPADEASHWSCGCGCKVASSCSRFQFWLYFHIVQPCVSPYRLLPSIPNNSRTTVLQVTSCAQLRNFNVHPVELFSINFDPQGVLQLTLIRSLTRMVLSGGRDRKCLGRGKRMRKEIEIGLLPLALTTVPHCGTVLDGSNYRHCMVHWEVFLHVPLEKLSSKTRTPSPLWKEQGFQNSGPQWSPGLLFE